jgi:hypothetical protein
MLIESAKQQFFLYDLIVEVKTDKSSFYCKSSVCNFSISELSLFKFIFNNCKSFSKNQIGSWFLRIIYAIQNWFHYIILLHGLRGEINSLFDCIENYLQLLKINLNNDSAEIEKLHTLDLQCKDDLSVFTSTIKS